MTKRHEGASAHSDKLLMGTNLLLRFWRRPLLLSGALICRTATMAQAAISRLSGLAGKARSTIEPSYKFAEKHVVDQYHKTMQANKQYVVQDEAAANKLFKQWFFTKMSRSDR